MIGENWHTTKRNALILAQPKGPTVCSCGAPGGSAHNHNTGQVIAFDWRADGTRALNTRAAVRLGPLLAFMQAYIEPISIAELASALDAPPQIVRVVVQGAARGSFVRRVGIDEYVLTALGVDRVMRKGDA